MSEMPPPGNINPPPGPPPGGNPPPPLAPGPPVGSSPGYPAPGGQIVSVAHNNQKALIAMILGIVMLPFALCCFPLGLVGGAVALVLGLASRREIAGSGGSQSGDGMAIAGIVLGGLEVAWAAILVVIVVLSIASGTYHGFSPGPGLPSH
jgi:hypothetical protein